MAIKAKYPQIEDPMCPVCGNSLSFVECCNQDNIEKKTAWNCEACESLVYIVQFANIWEEDKANETNRPQS